eukprot:3029426-Rhodomonas_salina.1
MKSSDLELLTFSSVKGVPKQGRRCCFIVAALHSKPSSPAQKEERRHERIFWDRSTGEGQRRRCDSAELRTSGVRLRTYLGPRSRRSGTRPQNTCTFDASACHEKKCSVP